MNDTEEKMSVPKEREVCRLVIDRNEVMANQIKNIVIEIAGSKLTAEELKDVSNRVSAAQTTSTDGTVGAISKLFSK
tara:strand:+ start:356 stop:586 length:231 start_codon:yes stop_codon:yes gene_type:complete